MAGVVSGLVSGFAVSVFGGGGVVSVVVASASAAGVVVSGAVAWLLAVSAGVG